MPEFNDRITAVTGTDMLALAERVREAAIPYLRQKAETEYLSDYRKVVLASLMEDERVRLTREGERVTETRLDTAARLSPTYLRFLQDVRTQKERLAELEAGYYALRNALDVATEQLRFARSEMYLQPNG